MSSRNVVEQNRVDASTRILDAAAHALASSERRPGIAELARRAGMSRPTVYRHFVDESAVFRALWEREIRVLLAATPRRGDDRAALVRQIVKLAERISTHETLSRTFVTEPSLVAPYILDHLGAGQWVLLESLRTAIAEVQAGGTIRRGRPGELAAMTLLIAQSATQSRRMIAGQLPGAAWRRELERALNGYLAP